MTNGSYVVTSHALHILLPVHRDKLYNRLAAIMVKMTAASLYECMIRTKRCILDSLLMMNSLHIRNM